MCIGISNVKIWRLKFAEPTGYSAPKLNGDGWQRVKAYAGKDIALLCESQSFGKPKEKCGFDNSCFRFHRA